MHDKMTRLQNLYYKKNDTPNYESIEDTLLDLANYAIIGLLVQRGQWEGYNLEDSTQKKRRAIESYLKTKIRESNFRETVSQLLYDYIDYGNVFAEVTYVNQVHTDPYTKEDITTYRGPKLQRISPFDIVFNPTATSFAESPKFTRYVKSLGELKKDIQYRPDLNYDDAAFKQATEFRKHLSAFQMEDVNKAEAYIIDGFGSLYEYYQSGLIEIIEFEGDIFDETKDELLEKRLITIIDRRYIIRNIENPSWLGRDLVDRYAPANPEPRMKLMWRSR